VQRVTILPPPQSCAQAPMTTLPLLALLVLLSRKRRAVLPLCALAFAAPVGAQEIERERVVAQGPFIAAVLAPDAKHVLVSDDSYQGLSVVDVESGIVTQLSLAERAGFRALWVDDARVAYRLAHAPFAGEPLVMLDLDGKLLGPHIEHAMVRARQQDVAVEVNGKQVSPPDDRCFAPIVSARGDVAYQCLMSGVHLWRDGRDHTLGQGAALSFSASGDVLAFVRSEDEGHVIVQSDIVVVDLRGKQPRVHVRKTPAIERSPSVSRDGRTIAFLVEDRLVVAELRLP
jgi:hypothetical protein